LYWWVKREQGPAWLGFNVSVSVNVVYALKQKFSEELPELPNNFNSVQFVKFVRHCRQQCPWQSENVCTYVLSLLQLLQLITFKWLCNYWYNFGFYNFCAE